MPVDAEGRAVAPTVVVYASGLAQLVAYYATCCRCTARYPFFSPPERAAWVEAHRTAHLDHPMTLTVEPWDFTAPPWVAASDQPLDPRSATMPFPLPDYDAATLAAIDRRRTLYQSGCPRHDALPDPERRMTFTKELLVGSSATGMHLSASFVYADACFMTVTLDVDCEPVFSTASRP